MDSPWVYCFSVGTGVRHSGGEDAQIDIGDISVQISFSGQSTGSIRMKMNFDTAEKICAILSDEKQEDSEPIDPDVLMELANMISGNAITAINAKGFHFVVEPPELYMKSEDEETENEISVPVTIPLQSDYGVIIIKINIHSIV